MEIDITTHESWLGVDIPDGAWLKFSHREICNFGNTYDTIFSKIHVTAAIILALLLIPGFGLAAAAMAAKLAHYIDGRIDKIKNYNRHSSGKGIKFKFNGTSITSWRRRGKPKGTGPSPC